MIWRFIGGLSDGEVIDTDVPPPGWDGDFTLPAPATLRMHVSKGNRTVYRLVAASPEEVVYQIDPVLTAKGRAMSDADWSAE